MRFGATLAANFLIFIPALLLASVRAEDDPLIIITAPKEGATLISGDVVWSEMPILDLVTTLGCSGSGYRTSKVEKTPSSTLFLYVIRKALVGGRQFPNWTRECTTSSSSTNTVAHPWQSPYRSTLRKKSDGGDL
ncbi:hypothetical protein BC826DRAFT_117355 [Russula brevipes]|nr:hypothetical protein BC826DRAFT_117355 [Russula brevipes]